MQFLVIFAVTLVVLLLLIVALLFGRPPTYRPSRQSVLDLLKGIADGTTEQHAWTIFLGSPIYHDEALESIRRECYEFDEGLLEQQPKPGLKGRVYDADGRAFINTLAEKLTDIIKHTPVTRDF